MIRIDLGALGPPPQQRATVALITTRISDAILSGGLASGTQIRQQALADHFSVSRMPVREALRQVQAKGLIEYRANRSFIVTAHKPEDAMTRITELEAQLRQVKEVFDSMYRDPQAGVDRWREMAGQQADDIDALLASIH